MPRFVNRWNWAAENPLSRTVRGALRRLVLTVLSGFVWLGATLVFLAFFSTGFSYVQDFVVVFVSLLALVGAVIALWVSFARTQARVWDGL
jgi:hypothetical protein